MGADSLATARVVPVHPPDSRRSRGTISPHFLAAAVPSCRWLGKTKAGPRPAQKVPSGVQNSAHWHAFLLGHAAGHRGDWIQSGLRGLLLGCSPTGPLPKTPLGPPGQLHFCGQHPGRQPIHLVHRLLGT